MVPPRIDRWPLTSTLDDTISDLEQGSFRGTLSGPRRVGYVPCWSVLQSSPIPDTSAKTGRVGVGVDPQNVRFGSAAAVDAAAGDPRRRRGPAATSGHENQQKNSTSSTMHFLCGRRLPMGSSAKAPAGLDR